MKPADPQSERRLREQQTVHRAKVWEALQKQAEGRIEITIHTVIQGGRIVGGSILQREHWPRKG